MTHDSEHVDAVRHGYDVLSYLYRGDADPVGPQYATRLERLVAALPVGAHVLDVGCGNGIPVARRLVDDGFQVTGVDLSDTQIRRARALVPGAAFVRGDITDLRWPPATFDAVLALYSVIHIPLSRQPALLADLARWTKPGGQCLLVAGATAWTGTEENWLGGAASMWWSHPDASTYRRWLAAAGWHVVDSWFVPEGDGGHQAFWSVRS
ncbi:class I SAM-dependent methyltransferase [uncultured Jatrophihabitans sp.]|uniref:class I SAM-dependent methyltransferase n=1 Tax=uncultured Jatrophihabitans sp. TaxID=1610747 RepID=UPI0035CB3071